MLNTLMSIFSAPEPTYLDTIRSHIQPHITTLTSTIQPHYTTYILPYTSAVSAHINHALLGLPLHWQARFGNFSTKQITHALQQIPVEQWNLALGGLCAGIVVTMTLLYLIAHKHTRNEVFTWTILWLSMCTIIHSWFELHFVFYRNTSSISLAMDLYSAGDFRYGRPLEAGTAAMEGITALATGPLAFLTAVSIVRDWSIRHVLQITVSVCQMYGLAWFIAQPIFATVESLTTDPVLFWLVAFAMNAPWGIAPPILWYKSLKAVSQQFSQNKTHKKL